MCPADVESSYSLSPIQEGFWLNGLLAAEPGRDLLQVVCTWREEVAAEALESAWRAVTERHAVLRTAFRWQALPEPVQDVARQVPVHLRIEDWADAELGERHGRLQTWLRQDRRQGIPLDAPPLWRVALLRLAPSEQVLVWTIHHAVVDGRSVLLVLEEVLGYYDAVRRGSAPPTREPPRPFRDAVESGAARDLAGAEAFWRRALDGYEAPPLAGAFADRAGDRARAGEPEHRELSRPISSDLAGALAELARRTRVTVATLVQGAWALLLGRSSGEEDVAFGSVLTCRRPELAGSGSMVGPLINTLPLRVSLPPEAPVRGWLEGLRRRERELRAHLDTPLTRVQAWSGLSARSALFDTLCMFERFLPGPELARRGWSRCEVRVLRQPGYPLTLGAFAESGLVLQVGYDRFFDDVTAHRVAHHLEQLLAGLVDGLEGPLRAVSMLSAAERHQVVVEWSAGADGAREESTIVAQFAEQVARRPQAPAVEGAGVTLSYAELDRRSRRLAARLRRLGAGPEQIVAVCLERSPDLVVALLAILRSGAAYLPLEPDHPRERLAEILRDAGAAVLVTSRAERDWLPPAAAARLVLLDEADGDESPRDLPAAVFPDTLAYVTYTSGSTGRPKGIGIAHRAVVGLVRDTDYLQLLPGARVAQLSTVAFDAATFEIWGALLNGACMVVIAKEVALTARRLGAELRERNVGVAFLTTALFHQLAQESPGEFAILDELLIGGDALDPRRVREVLAAGPPRRLLNVYGPTENTTFSTWHPVASVSPREGTVPIGRAIANTEAYVLNRRGGVVGVGASGELCLGGGGLARGYVGRPELTAERFVPDGVSGAWGARLYRTGDRVRLRGDGVLEFLGRLDRQVKVRGVRVEPAEVEAVVRRHEGVADAVVEVRQRPGGERCLVAYLVPQGGGEGPSWRELRGYVESQLPEALVPGAWVVVPQLPLNVQGKVDRRALPEPRWEQGEGVEGAALTPVEELLAGMWEELLGVRGVGVGDDFFALGGHSLLASRLVSRVVQVLGVEVPLRRVFGRRTLGELAREVEGLRRREEESETAVLVRVERGGELPLSFAQERLWWMDRLEPGESIYTIGYGLDLVGEVRAEALAAALAGVVARHEALRTRLVPVESGARAVQVVEAGGERGLPMVDLGGLGPEAEAEARRLWEREVERPFDLARGPVVRWALLRLGGGRSWLLVTLHHVAADGWSLGVLAEELESLYGAAVEGKAAPLVELPVQYADYAVWQRQRLQGEALAGELAFWEQRLAGAPATVEMPWDRPPGAAVGHAGGCVELALPEGLEAELGALARREGATLFMVSLAGCVALLGRVTGAEELTVGTPVAGRVRAELEGLIGLFVNLMVLRADLRGALSFGELLGRVRETALEAYDHQEVPFEKVVERLRPERGLSHSPLFQVSFAVEEPLRVPRLAEVEARLLEAPLRRAKFDLGVTVERVAGGLRAVASYRCSLFDATTVQRLLGQLGRLLTEAAAAPQRRLGELPLLSAAERHQVVVEWSAGADGAREESTIVAQFAEQVARRPQAPAVEGAGVTLSYAELDRRSRRLAARLRRLGAGPEQIVAVCLERSPDLVVALFAILRSGAAYLPLEPSEAVERTVFMVKDSGALLTLTQQSLAGLLPREVTAVALETLANDAPGEDPEEQLPEVTPEALAYVIYTSGSTGQPKGVMIRHGSICNYLSALLHDCYRLREEDRMLWFSALSFDVSAEEVFLPLVGGATLVVRDEETIRSPEEVLASCRRWQITVLSLPTAFWHELAAAVVERQAALPASIRLVTIGGERIGKAKLAAWRAAGLDVRLLNGYGPTEATVAATLGDVAGPAWNRSAGQAPIGRPIAGARALILDGNLQPLPIGVAGELYLGGPGLARGYRGRPELTAERFAPDPFARDGRGGALLYRTGDLVRHLPDGSLDFVGRYDFQVKVRGFRVEPGEVEAVLAAHPDVHETAVVAPELLSGDVRLVAYVVPAADRKPAARELRDFLRARLPGYMVPAVFEHLDALPRTASGKTDRSALAALGYRTPGGAATAPVTPEETVLAEIWAEVLATEPPGTEANFFDLGGHSLLGVRLMARLRERLQVDLPLRTLFEAPVLADLARIVAEARAGRPSAAAPPALLALEEGTL